MSDVSVTPLGNGRFQVSDGERQRIAYAVATATQTWIFLDGRTYVVDRSGRRQSRRGTHHDDQAALASPMPATVARVNVQPGQAVARGDVLIMLEAMKMELPLRAPHDGVVRAVHCTPGQLVQPGIPLVELA